MADSVPRPRAVLIASAHWETGAADADRSAKPRDDPRLRRLSATSSIASGTTPGAPEVAQRARRRSCSDAGIAAGIDGCRGIDHGAWVPLRYMYPERDVPVVQLSVQPARGTAHHLAMGRALAPLPHEDVLVIGSGHVTHNLRDWMGAGATPDALPYVPRRSPSGSRDTLRTRDDDALLDYRERAPRAARAHPTEEHFLPLFVAWGAAGPGATCQRVLRRASTAPRSRWMRTGSTRPTRAHSRRHDDACARRRDGAAAWRRPRARSHSCAVPRSGAHARIAPIVRAES